MKKIKEKKIYLLWEVSVNFVYVVVQLFYPWFVFYFPLFWSMVIYDNVFETMENKT